MAADRSIGRTPQQKVSVEKENLTAARAGRHRQRLGRDRGCAAGPADPLDTKLWGMRMIKADEAHATSLGNAKVRVGVMDTGVQADHPDLQRNFDYTTSRNFVTDDPAIDGPCEYARCIDPAGVDNNGHGTHVAGTIAAALNGFGLSGVSPNASLVEVRAGQDSGYFFLPRPSTRSPTPVTRGSTPSTCPSTSTRGSTTAAAAPRRTTRTPRPTRTRSSRP